MPCLFLYPYPVPGPIRPQTSSNHKTKDFLWKAAFIWTAEVFLVCCACSHFKILADFDLWPVPNFQLCIKQATEVYLAAISHIQRTLAPDFTFPSSQSWLVPAPPYLLLWALCCAESASCGFLPSGFWLCVTGHVGSHKLSQSLNSDQQ